MQLINFAAYLVDTVCTSPELDFLHKAILWQNHKLALSRCGSMAGGPGGTNTPQVHLRKAAMI